MDTYLYDSDSGIPFIFMLWKFQFSTSATKFAFEMALLKAENCFCLKNLILRLVLCEKM